MKRIATAGLCLVATLACSAAIASVAQAAEIGLCLKMSQVDMKFTGHFVGKRCQVHASSEQIAEGKKNKYEWYPGLTGMGVDGTTASRFTFAAPIQAKNRPPEKRVLLRTSAIIINGKEAAVTCATSTAEGEWTGPTTGVETLRLQECKLSINESPCTSTGLGTGEMETSPLALTVIGNGETREQFVRFNEETMEWESYPQEPAEGSVWLESSAAPGEPYLEYACGSLTFRTLGTLAGNVVGPLRKQSGEYMVGNAMRKKMITSFGPGAGIQDLYTEYSENGGESYEFGGLTDVYANRYAKGTGTVELRKLPTT